VVGDVGVCSTIQSSNPGTGRVEYARVP
jgi:hypothetical protein